MVQPTPISLALALALVSCACARAADGALDLPRPAALGVGMEPAQQGGALIRAVAPNLTAAKLGLAPGDVVVEADGTVVQSPAELGAYVAHHRAGDPIRLKVRRGERVLALRATAIGRPPEPHPGATVSYGATPFRSGRLRDILVLPAGKPDAPVVFLLPGLTCDSIEPADPNHPYRLLADALLAKGVGYYRVERPGVGDSIGPLRCEDIDYATDLEAYRAAYAHLIDARGVAPSRIFIFGHSLGGLEAPMIAPGRPPRGIAVFGTILRNWGDYHRRVGLVQPFLTAARDPAELEARSERDRTVFDRFYVRGESPAAIASNNPAAADTLRRVFQWDGKDQVLQRSYHFVQDLAHQSLVAAWRDSKTSVLAMYGESDFVALTDTDSRLIADVVNHYRPGTAKYALVPGTDHNMLAVGPPAAFRRQLAQQSPPDAPFSPEIARILTDWIATLR